MAIQDVREKRGPPRGPAINLVRLRSEMAELGEIGRTDGQPGINRLGYSEADMRARAFMAERMEGAGLTVSMDSVGNLSGLWQVGSAARVMVGSHLDTVPNGGLFDGALGVCAALECVRAMKEADITPQRPMEVIATAEEEGRFGGMLGAQALAGAVEETWFRSAVDESGLLLTDALRSQGFDPDCVLEAARDPERIHAFLELHIEQGPVLEHEGLQIGIVERISGVFKWSVRLRGVANHAGTTPMELRKDALVGLAEFIASIPGIIAEAGTDESRVTVGTVEVKPNHPHTIPGEAVFSLIGRDGERSVMLALAASCRDRLDGIAERGGLALEIVEQSWLDPAPCSPEIVAAFERQAQKLDLRYRTMPSGAGHDTQFMSGLTRAGLIFVPSIGGISHAPEERTEWSDVEAGATLLLHTVVELAGG